MARGTTNKLENTAGHCTNTRSAKSEGEGTLFFIISVKFQQTVIVLRGKCWLVIVTENGKRQKPQVS